MLEDDELVLYSSEGKGFEFLDFVIEKAFHVIEGKFEINNKLFWC